MNHTFEVGQTYTARSICDSNCVFAFEVVKRTAKFITISNAMFDEPKRVGTYIYEGREVARPYGTYSMGPTIFADRSAS